MQLAGLAPGDVVGLVRDARRAADADVRLAVTGVLAGELARSLGTEVARVGGEPADATALVVVLGGAPTEDDQRAMRSAARARVPIVAVQTDPRFEAPLPYVTADAVVSVPAGQGFPVGEIATVLARELGPDAVVLAADAPALREPIVRELVRRASIRAAVVGALPWRKEADFPALALVQARLVLDVAAAHGQPIGQERAPELGAVAGTGLGFRGLVRRLPTRVPLIGGITGYLATRAIGEAAIRRFSAS